MTGVGSYRPRSGREDCGYFYGPWIALPRIGLRICSSFVLVQTWLASIINPNRLSRPTTSLQPS